MFFFIFHPLIAQTEQVPHSCTHTNLHTHTDTYTHTVPISLRVLPPDLPPSAFIHASFDPAPSHSSVTRPSPSPLSVLLPLLHYSLASTPPLPPIRPLSAATAALLRLSPCAIYLENSAAAALKLMTN